MICFYKSLKLLWYRFCHGLITVESYISSF